ncbi:MAG: SUMF1/EgtB/PvdO family nonheme iron enzyme [Planctomycetes bacterium]|nr:SUMF1/EgtB/PvdO family nonheme iron enzyme [Planctomycetota bacterium]
MPDRFDPYYEWLEIPPSKRPPSDRDLVGVEEGETDLGRIREAAAARIEQIRKLTLSPQREHALRLLNEVSEALVSLRKAGEADAAEIKGPPPLADVATQSEQPAAPPEVPPPSTEVKREDAAETRKPPPPVEFASPPEQPAVLPKAGIEPVADLPRDGERAPHPIRALIPAPVLRVDRFLKHLAGEENDILHTFMRVLTVVLVVSSFVGLIWITPRFVNAVFVARTQPDGSDTGIDQPEKASPPTPSEPSPPDEPNTDAGEAATKTPPNDEPLPATITNSIGMKLALIPAGEFLMGLGAGGLGGGDDDPQHLVQITKPFCLGVYEVTQKQYWQVMSEIPSGFKGDYQRPVERVSWEDAVEFCRRLSEKEGETYRLPTEAEWEYACRAGSTTTWYFGDSESRLGDYAWYSANSSDTTHPVGQKKPNAWGLYDMHGNVWEWCSDWHDKDHYSASPAIDPKGPDSGDGRVLRGGSWRSWTPLSSYPRSVGSALCTWSSPANRHSYNGFRLARTP